jgi:hypothetical protein
MIPLGRLLMLFCAPLFTLCSAPTIAHRCSFVLRFASWSAHVARPCMQLRVPRLLPRLWMHLCAPHLLLCTRGPLRPRGPPSPASPCHAYSLNTCNIKAFAATNVRKRSKHLQRTLATYVYGHYNICNIWIKRLQHMFETVKTCEAYTCNIVYSQCNIYNIRIKHLQHTFETAKTFETYTCNIHV